MKAVNPATNGFLQFNFVTLRLNRKEGAYDV
jgi:hypothetical protein